MNVSSRQARGRPVRVLLGILAALLFTSQIAAAQFGRSTPRDDDPSPHSDVELISRIASIQPGEPFTVGLWMDMETDWHSYWTNAGDAGQATRIDWRLPDGFTASDFEWPYPERIPAGPLVSYGYSDQVLLRSTITPPADLEPGSTVTLEGTAKWLICAEICLPAEEEIRLELPVRTGEPAPSEAADRFRETRDKLPAETPEAWSVTAARSEGSYALQVAARDADLSLQEAYFYPYEKAVLEYSAPQVAARAEEMQILVMQASAYEQEPVDTLRGVLVAPEGVTWPGGIRAVELAAPVDTSAVVPNIEAAATPSSSPSSEASMTLFWALLLALGGGILLNLMPCVFPVLSIKILGFARQTEASPRSMRRHGFVFGAGVLVSFWALAGLLLLLREGGSQIGWGFQLQSPLFVSLLALLFFGIALNLLGVFEVGTMLTNWGGRVDAEQSADSYSGSFLSGVLATIVATPCTAPLMGAALGFAVTLSAGSALLIFTALGVGMALPYVLLSSTPRLLNRLPKPGAWMETLRQALAFPMFAAALWLVWVYGRQTGIDGITLLLGSFLLVALAAWIVGRWNSYQISTRTRLLTRGVAGALLAVGLAAAVAGAEYERAPLAGDDDASWQTFAPDKVDQLRETGRPVFVDFTAAWCLTCQVNKRTTLQAESVQEAFAEKNVALMRADWTNRDSVITRALAEHGRNGVPLYVLYAGDDTDPQILPEVLTPGLVLDALEALPGPSLTAASSTEAASRSSDTADEAR